LWLNERVLTYFDERRRTLLALLQAGGRRFDPGTLHFQQ
jgi:hypothetical protein